MKMALLFMAALGAASTSNAAMVCTSSNPDGIFSGDFMGTKTLKIEKMDGDEIVLTFGDNQKFEGSFSKKAKSGASVYECGELTDVADQTDIGNILVSAKVVAGKPGTLTLSTRQLGDSEGSTWLNETFSCKPE